MAATACTRLMLCEPPEVVGVRVGRRTSWSAYELTSIRCAEDEMTQIPRTVPTSWLPVQSIPQPPLFLRTHSTDWHRILDSSSKEESHSPLV